MRFTVFADDNETEPKGKKSVRITVAGSVVGYIAGKFWISFGERSDPHAFTLANEWLAS